MRIPKSWLSIEDLFASNRARTRKRRGTIHSPDVRERSQVETEALESRLLLSSTNDPVFPDGLGHDDPAVRAAIQNVTTTGSQAPIYSLGSTSPNSNASGPLINVDDFRADPRFAGIDGGGYSTVILDTGIDLDHPFFGPDGDGDGVADRIVFQQDFADNDNDASDVNGHGSNVSSIVASSDGTFTGMAPGANVIHLKVFQNNGAGNFAFVEDALQWVIANADTFNIISVNMSLGDTRNHATEQTLAGVDDELAALAAIDVITVSASGNSFFGFGSAQGVSYPAADPNSISVGAVWDSGGGQVNWGDGARDITRGPGRITSFSQRHETLTTIFAPGAFITGAGPTGGTISQGGTSQASPHISGIAVLAQDLAIQTLGRKLSVAEFTNVMVASASTINDGDDEDDNVTNTGLDFPLVDVFALGEAILALSPAISIAAADADKAEGSGGSTSFTFDVTRTGDLSIGSSVEYVVAGAGTDAANAADFGGAFPSGTVTFAANEVTKQISIDVVGDTLFEPNETFIVSLTNPVLGQLGTAEAQGVIQNDDVDGDNIVLSFADLLITESAGVTATTATITRTGDISAPLIIGLVNGDDTEISIPSSVTIAAGESAVTFAVDAVDDNVSDGTQTVVITATAAGLPTVSSSIDVRDNDVNPFTRVFPLGGLVAESINSATLMDSSDTWEFDLFLDVGETLAIVASPDSAEQLTIELVSLSGPQTSPAAGQSAIVAPQLIATAGIYKLRITGTGTTNFQLKLYRNTAIEQQVGESGPGTELAIDNSLLSVDRYAVIGESIAQPTGVSGYRQFSDAAVFEDIAATGTALNLGDDGMDDIVTTVGNDIFPAGIVSVSNNGGIVAGAGAQLVFQNTALPSAEIVQALMPFWDDIDSETGNVYWEERQVNGIDTLIVQWDNRPHFDNLDSSTFQLQLFATGPIRLRYAYRDVEFGDAEFDFGASATIGFQQDATTAQQFSFDQPVLANDDVVEFFIETPSDVDNYTVDLTGKTGNRIDIVLAARNAEDFSGDLLELLAPDGTTVLATAVADPVQAGTSVTGFDLGILDFVVPADGVYTVRVTSETAGEYTIVATDSISFNSEADAATDPIRSISDNRLALGFVDAGSDVSDNYTVDLIAGLTATITTATVFDSASGSPLNSLNPEIIVFDSTGAIVATDTDSSSDNKNATAIFAVPATGTYRIEVVATSGIGEYMLSVSESTVPALVVDIAADSVAETAGVTATTVTITRTSDTTNMLMVDLFSDDSSEATIIDTVIIPAGADSVTVDLAVHDEALLDGIQTVTISATADGHEGGADTIDVTDDETASAELSVITQGNEKGPIDIVFAVSLGITNDTGSPITFDISDLGSGSATAAADYAALPSDAVISVAPGANSGSFTIAVVDDALLESLETVTTEISNSSHPAVSIGTAEATANIDDDEIATADLSVVTNGNETGPVQIELNVTLDKPNNTGTDITFDLDDLLSGSATSGADYSAVAADAQLIVAPGASTASLSIVVIDDGLLESVETVVTQISNSSNSAVGLGIDTVTANILDDDAAIASISVLTNGSETGPVSVVYNVTLDKPNNTGSAITFELSDVGSGSADSGGDYTAIPASTLVSIAAGASSATYSVDVIDDAFLEDLETVTAQIANSSFAAVTIGTASATADIVDNDSTTLDLVATTHGNETGPVDIVYTVTLGNENRTSAAITFDFDDLGSGTATSGLDFATVPTDTVLSIAVGESTTSFVVTVTDDTLLESTETVVVGISNSSNTSVGFARATATADIVDNDAATADLVVTTLGDEDGPVNVVFTVELSQPNNTAVPITFEFDDLTIGTATSTADYAAIPADAQIVVAVGASSGSYTVNVVDDDTLETTETLTGGISGSSSSAFTIVTDSALATIDDNETATASLSVTSQGDEAGPVDLVYTVTLSNVNNTGSSITFDFDDLATGSATPDADFSAIPADAQIVVENGEASGSFVVAVLNDTFLESTETVIGRILNSSNSTVSIVGGAALGSISDDDTADAALLVATDGHEDGPVDIVFTVALNKANDTDSVLTFALNDLGTGTAVAGSDYTVIPTDSVISIAPGEIAGSLTVPVTNDALLESVETLEVQLSNPSLAEVSIISDTAFATITDNDTAAASLSAVGLGNETGPASVVYEVTLTKVNDTGADITFDIADLATGTAGSGIDYTALAANAQVIVAVGESSGTFTVEVIDDSLLESSETVDLQISNSSNSFASISSADATGTIIDDESTTANLSVTQDGAETGPVDIIFTVTLTEPNNTGAAITFELDDLATGTATSAGDYTAIPDDAQLSIAIGATTASYTVIVAEDDLLESTETVVAGISAASHSSVNLGAASATANITDNDSAMASFAVFSSGGEVVNTNIVYEVTLTKQNDTAADISFDFDDLATGTAISGADYVAIPDDAVIVVAIGASTGRFSVPLNDDTLLEATETISTGISNSSNAEIAIGISEATGTINDNEVAEAELAVTTHGAEAGPVDIVFTVSLDLTNNTDANITFAFADLATGTATSAVDYTAVAAITLVTVPIGSKVGTITIPVIDDSLLESLETVDVEISSSSSTKVTISQANASANITSDDDATAELSVTTHGSEAGPTDVVYTVTLDESNDTAAAITFDISDLGSGSATTDLDYSSIPAGSKVSVPVGSNVGTYTVAVVDDILLEDTETIAAGITNSSETAVAITRASAVAMITSDETAVADLLVTADGNETGPTDIVFTIQLDKPNDSGSDITFDLTDLASGTATRSLDYAGLAPNSRITVKSGESSGTAALAVVDDVLLESIETVVLEVSNSSLAAVTIGNASAIANIVDNETAVADLSLTANGDEDGPVDITYTATLTKPNDTGVPIVFDFADTGLGTATSVADYSAVAAGAQLSVAPGETTATVTVGVVDDSLLESIETLIVDISNSSNSAVTIGDALAEATISSNDTATAGVAASTNGLETGPVDVVFTISLDKTNNTDSAITFDLDDLVTGSALSGIDYAAIPDDTVVSIAVGSSAASLTVGVTDDSLLESTEQINVQISNSSNSDVALTTAFATATITDDETSVASLTVSSTGDEDGPTDIVYSVTLDKQNDTDSPIVFDFDDSGTGSALSGLDYAAIPGDAVLSVAVGSSVATFQVPVNDDSLLESLETVTAEISNSSNAAVSIGSASATADIIDNEVAIANLSVASNGDEAGPIDVTLLVTLSLPNDTGSVITFDVDDLLTGTAASGVDYSAVAADAQISIPVGADSGTLTISVTDDILLEDEEDLSLELSNSSFASVLLGTTSATATINSDERAIADLSVSMQGAEAGSTAVELTLTLDLANFTSNAITVDVADMGTGSASSGLDYASLPAGSQFSVPIGSDTATLTIAVSDDTLLESTETIDAEISKISSSLVSLGTASATANIVDNDTAVADLTVTTHGDEAGPVAIVLTATLDKINDTDSPITFELADLGSGSAVSTVDYTAVAANSQIVIPVGASFGSLTINVTDDVLVEAAETVETQLSSSSNAAVSVGVATAVANLASDDVAGFATAETGGATLVAESGTSDTFDVVLNARPQSDVVFNIFSADSSEVSVNPTTVTFTTSDWNVVQTITVTGIDDTAPDGGQSTAVTIAVDSTLSDPLFATVGSQLISVLTSDDEPGRLDVDSNGTPNAATDGILIIRYLFGFTGDALIQDAIGGFAGNTTAQEIVAALLAAPEMLDVDGDGRTDATTDGILVVRYLFGFRGDALVENVIGTGAVRTTGQQVEDFLDGFLPPSTGGFGSSSAGGSGGAKSGPSSSPDSKGSEQLDVDVTQSESGVQVVWNSVSSADAYRVFVQPVDGDGFVRRIDTTEPGVSDLNLAAGGYRMWVEAINLTTGEVVASGELDVQIAEAKGDGFGDLSSLRFAVLESANADEIAEAELNSDDLSQQNDHVYRDSASESTNADGQLPEAAVTYASAGVIEQQDYLNSDAYMEAWMTDALWIE